MAVSANDKIVRGADLAVVGAQVKAKLAEKQDALVSGTNIKTINNTSLLGDGDITIANGQNGASAYELWLASGNTGTMQDFLESLKGEPGSSIDYPFTLADDLVTTDTTKALAAPQGVALKGLYDGLFSIVERNYTNGYKLDTIGNTVYDSKYIISNKIPVSNGASVYWRYNCASDASIKLVEYSANGTKIEQWGATSNTGRTIVVDNPSTAYVIATIPSAQFYSGYVNVDGVRAWTPSDGVAGEIASLKKTRDTIFSGGKYEEFVPITWNNDNQYMGVDGVFISSESAHTSSLLFVPAGVTIKAELGAGPTCSAIAVVEEDGTFIRNAATGKGNTSLGPYTFTADDDCYIMFSGRYDTHSYITFLYDASAINGNNDEEIIYSGELVGYGDTLSYHRFPARQGDYLHIFFPNGDWSTKQNRGNYNKLILGSVRIDGVGYSGGADVLREGWVCPEYGFDFIVEPFNIHDTISEPYGGLSYRAASGVRIPFIISKLSKTTPKKCFDLEMARTIRSVKERIVDGQSLVFAICSDLHYRDIEEGYRPFAQFSPIQMAITMRGFTEKVRTDNVVCLGDISDGRWTAARAELDAYVCQWFLGQCKAPVLNVVGNHDDNRYYGQEDGDRRLTQAEIYSNMMSHNDERVTVDGAMGGCNYYRDIDRAKVRLIVLMGIDFDGNYKFTTETQNWLSDTFFSMPEGWKAIIFTHIPPVAAQNWSGTAYSGGGYISDIISANLDKFLFLYEGHTHIDNVYVSPWTAINIGCQKVYNSESGTNEPGSAAPEGAWWPIRAAGDYREVLWDAVVVDQTNSILSCIRFGAGVDRYIHLEPITLAAGGSVSLTPSVITATSWETRASEAESISITNGVASLTSSAVSGSRHIAIAKDTDGNMEIWCIKVS